MKRPLTFVTAVLMTSLYAQSGQIHPEGSPTPRCFTGSIQTALEELKKGDFDPRFSAASYITGSTIVGLQVDESKQVLKTNLQRCQGSKTEVNTTSDVLSWTKKELSALTGESEPVEAVKKARQLLKLANPKSNSNCKFQLIQEQTTNSEFPSIFLKLESGSQKHQATILSDGHDIGVRTTKDSLEIGPGLGDTHGTEFTIQWNREFELIEIKASTKGGLIQHQLYCGFELK